MVLKHRVALNGTQLDSLDNRILIQSVDEAAGKDTITAVSLGGADGQRITGKRRDTLDVTVKFSINERNMEARSTLLDTINAWAYGGGTLTLNNRTNKNLTVELVQAPGGGDQFKWTSEYTLVFRAYVEPAAKAGDALLVLAPVGVALHKLANGHLMQRYLHFRLHMRILGNVWMKYSPFTM